MTTRTTCAEGISPQKKIHFHDGLVAYLFGAQVPGAEGKSWSIANPENHQHMGTALNRLESGPGRVLCPRPVFSRKIATPPELDQPVWLNDNIAAYRGQEADGVYLPPRHSYLLCSADCHTVVLSDHATVVCLHCGRDSMIDKSYVSGNGNRPKPTLIETALDRYWPRQEDRRAIHAWVLLGIAAKHFAHPHDDERYGAKNQNMTGFVLEYFSPTAVARPIKGGRLNMESIIWANLRKAGVPAEQCQFSQTDTFGQRVNGQHAWHSNRRDAGTCNQGFRNMVVVVRE